MKANHVTGDHVTGDHVTGDHVTGGKKERKKERGEEKDREWIGKGKREKGKGNRLGKGATMHLNHAVRCNQQQGSRK